MDYKNTIQSTVKALKAILTIIQLVALAATLVAEGIYANRQQIREAAVRVVAATIVTAEAAYKAGQATRNWVERMNASSAEALKEMPEQIAPVAPIVAPVVVVAKSATAALTNWLQLDSVDTAEVTEEIEPVSVGFGEQLVRSMDELMALPAATLRKMANTRARYSKAKLVAMLMVA